MRPNQRLDYKQQIIVITYVIVIGLLLAGCGITQPKTFTVGVINLPPVLEAVLEGFKDGMAELGYVEGENITYIYEGPAGSIDRLDSVAQSLVDAKVDLILSISTPATLAAKRVTAGTDIPVIFVPVTDPVGAGIVDSLKQPGGNITGVTFGVQEARRLEWLMKIAPATKQVYIPYNSEDPSPMLALETVREAAANLGVELILREARNPEEIAAALENIPEEADAIYLLPDSVVESQWTDIQAVAIAHRLPTSVARFDGVEAGALYSYAMKLESGGEQAARLADQIFKGAKPGDLPVEITEFFLAINLPMAEAIGLEVPYDVLEAADTIIR